MAEALLGVGFRNLSTGVVFRLVLLCAQPLCNELSRESARSRASDDRLSA